MDLFNSFLDERIYTDCADVNRMNGDNQDTAQSRNTPSLFPTRTLHSPFGRDGNGNEKHDPDENYNGNANGKTRLTPTEACEVFSVFIAEAEALTSLFIPFNIVLAFFGVADLYSRSSVFS